MSLQILWVARTATLPGAGFKSHTHLFYHMFCVTKGVCPFVVAGKPMQLHEGQCLLIPERTRHCYTNTTCETAEYLEIKFALPASALDTQLRESGVQVTEHPLAEQLIRQILQEYSRRGSAADAAAGAYLTAVLHLFSQDPGQMSQSQPFLYVDASRYSPLSQRVIRYLETHYSQNVSLDDLAQALEHNKSYLCVAFKKDTQLTIWDCLNMIRVRKAAELIFYSDHALSHVAELCGFPCVSTFNRAFAKYMGTTPGQCRRAYPEDILMGPQNLDPDQFIYSVLARKQFTPEQMLQMNGVSPKEE